MKNSFPIYLILGKLFSNSQRAITLSNLKKLGELKNKQIVYSPFEALYLVENKKAEILINNNPLTENQIIKIFSKKHKEFFIKYLVFRYLRKKGYIVKTGLKFGAEFRVYSNPKNQKDSLTSSHAKWLVHILKQKDKLDLKEFISINRIAHSTAKKLLLVIVDSEEGLSFYETDWIKL